MSENLIIMPHILVFFTKKALSRFCLFYLVNEFCLTIVKAHLSPIEVPAYQNERCNVPINNRTKKEAHEFIPVPTIAGFIFIGVWLGFIMIAKIMYNSSDQYKINNRFDLVIFRPAAKNSLIGPRRIYSNNNVNTQNINAAATSGIDLTVLNIRNTYKPVSNSNPNENGNFSSSSSLNKMSI
ncbi:hypothetical protein BpHYR1_037493 [Brachionus plicatilis]|uniref:Uncharacterized protein n=1 Tax=Brachionus plicatilis TaxID=10195 RepID=A0A3M7PJA1_BRAPC|nr:hypothetical protein BpHYR1_037493 [Brachionus plicatilis]